MRKKIVFIVLAGFFVTLGFISRELYESYYGESTLTTPFISKQEEPELPLLDYTFAILKDRTYNSSPIVIESVQSEEELYKTYVFSYTTLGKKMTGQLNIPNTTLLAEDLKPKVIVLVRGYVPQNIYSTGVGTKNAAAVFAKNGYITLAPDFFGYGESDPEPTDTWQARFEKPIILIELIKSVETNGVPTSHSQFVYADKEIASELTLTPTRNIGIWAHSNGGQITLASLEILSRPIPTTLWAPVTAPFPYSILYFSDEEQDEGKASRKFVSLLEEEYDVFDFSLTKHLDWLTGPIQLHHGTDDEAAPIVWSDEFVDKIEVENKRRTEILTEIETEPATDSGTRNQLVDKTLLQFIELTYYRYQATDHNMQPEWNTAIQRDLQFFEEKL